LPNSNVFSTNKSTTDHEKPISKNSSEIFSKKSRPVSKQESRRSTARVAKKTKKLSSWGQNLPAKRKPVTDEERKFKKKRNFLEVKLVTYYCSILLMLKKYN
jgi:hypothetical protein